MGNRPSQHPPSTQHTLRLPLTAPHHPNHATAATAFQVGARRELGRVGGEVGRVLRGGGAGAQVRRQVGQGGDQRVARALGRGLRRPWGVSEVDGQGGGGGRGRGEGRAGGGERGGGRGRQAGGRGGAGGGAGGGGAGRGGLHMHAQSHIRTYCQPSATTRTPSGANVMSGTRPPHPPVPHPLIINPTPPPTPPCHAVGGAAASGRRAGAVGRQVDRDLWRWQGDQARRGEGAAIETGVGTWAGVGAGTGTGTETGTGAGADAERLGLLPLLTSCSQCYNLANPLAPFAPATQVWSAGGGGERYNRWWNEEHYGDGRVRRWGNSTSGEYWDGVEHMDTYYNPVPHFG